MPEEQHWGPNQHIQAGIYLHSLEKFLPQGSGVPLKFLNRRGQFHTDNRHFGGVEVVAAVDLPTDYTDAELALQAYFHLNTNDKEYDMTDRRAVIRHSLEQLQAELFEIEQFGEDNFDENTVLVFDMKFPNTETIFTYAAIKKDGNWFITGVSNGQYMTWPKLVGFWKEKVVSIHKVTAFEEIYLREGTEKAKALEGEVLPASTHNPETGAKYDDVDVPEKKGFDDPDFMSKS
jgi:hypothetical protein